MEEQLYVKANDKDISIKRVKRVDNDFEVHREFFDHQLLYFYEEETMKRKKRIVTVYGRKAENCGEQEDCCYDGLVVEFRLGCVPSDLENDDFLNTVKSLKYVFDNISYLDIMSIDCAYGGKSYILRGTLDENMLSGENYNTLNYMRNAFDAVLDSGFVLKDILRKGRLSSFPNGVTKD